MPKQPIKKILVNKSDEVALVVEKIIDADAKEVILNIPRFSKLSDSLANFHLIKRESKLLNKKVIIESVDDKVIELAGLSGLESLNPVFIRSRRQFSDIVSSRSERSEAAEDSVNQKKMAETVRGKGLFGVLKGIRPKSFFPKIRLPSRQPRTGENGGSRMFRRMMWGAGAAVMLGIIAWLVLVILPRAEVKAVTKKNSWVYKDAIVAEKLSAIDSVKSKIPAQIFSERKTLESRYPATGKKAVQKKATGKITVYNAYSSDPQPLVASTRFVTPDGKIFRLAKGTTIPGAKIVSGKVIPSSIDLSVIADKPGSDYNIGPVNYFSVPGFEGTPKYQGFYGESKDPMSGGVIGEVPVPTDSDIKLAKTEAVAKIEAELKNKITGKIPSSLKIIDGASSFVVLSQKVNQETDEAGNFVVTIEARLDLGAFKEEDLLKMLSLKMKKDIGAEYSFKSQEIIYAKARLDSDAGRLSFPLDFKSVASRSVDVDLLRQQVLGKTEADLRALILTLPDLDTAHISLWPFWVTRVPTAPSKVKIVVE